MEHPTRWKTLSVDVDAGPDKSIRAVSFSPDSKRLAFGIGKLLQIWRVKPLEQLHRCEGQKDQIDCIFWSPDGAVLLSGSGKGDILSWDPRTGGQTGKPLEGRIGWTGDIAWMPCHLAYPCTTFACAGRKYDVCIWDVVDRTLPKRLACHNGRVICCRWSGDGFIVAGFEDGTIKVWDPTRVELIRELMGHANKITSLTFTTDFALRFGAYGGRRWNEIDEMRDVALDVYNALRGHGPEVLASASCDRSLCFWNMQREDFENQMVAHDSPIVQVSFSPNGNLLATCSLDGAIKLWDPTTGIRVAGWKAHTEISHIRWSPDSHFLVSAGKDSVIKLWDVEDQKLKKDERGHAKIQALDWSPNGHVIAAGTSDGLILWVSRS